MGGSDGSGGHMSSGGWSGGRMSAGVMSSRAAVGAAPIRSWSGSRAVTVGWSAVPRPRQVRAPARPSLLRRRRTVVGRRL